MFIVYEVEEYHKKSFFTFHNIIHIYLVDEGIAKMCKKLNSHSGFSKKNQILERLFEVFRQLQYLNLPSVRSKTFHGI